MQQNKNIYTLQLLSMNNYGDYQELIVKIAHIPEWWVIMIISLVLSLFIDLNMTLPK